MTNEQIGMVLSLCGMVLTVISFQAKNKIPLLILQTIGSTLYMISYVFSGGGIAVVLNAIMLIRNFSFMYLSGRKGRIIYITCGALCASYVIAYVMYTILANEGLASNLWNMLPVAAAFFGTVSFANTNVNRLRMWKYGDSVCWLSFNLHIGIGALGGILGEVLNLISLTIGILRFREKKNAAK